MRLLLVSELLSDDGVMPYPRSCAGRLGVGVVCASGRGGLSVAHIAQQRSDIDVVSGNSIIAARIDEAPGAIHRIPGALKHNYRQNLTGFQQRLRFGETRPSEAFTPDDGLNGLFTLQWDATHGWTH
jgi:hypothetical protein